MGGGQGTGFWMLSDSVRPWRPRRPQASAVWPPRGLRHTRVCVGAHGSPRLWQAPKLLTRLRSPQCGQGLPGPAGPALLPLLPPGALLNRGLDRSPPPSSTLGGSPAPHNAKCATLSRAPPPCQVGCYSLPSIFGL